MNTMGTWEEVFKKRGKVFTKVQKDIPRMARIFKKKKFKRILDIGCGTGRHTVYLAKKGFDVYGFDASRTGVDFTKRWLKREGLNANVMVHDMAKRFPYPDNFFDAVISIQVIHHNRIEKVRKTIKEIRRVLRKDGMIFITVPFSRDWESELKEIAPDTFVPSKGQEKGLVHYLFTKKKVYEEFRGFVIKDVSFDKHVHLRIIGVKK